MENGKITNAKPRLNSFAIKEKLDESLLVQLISIRENEYQSTIFTLIHRK